MHDGIGHMVHHHPTGQKKQSVSEQVGVCQGVSHNSSCGQLMFLQVSVCPRGDAWWGHA